MQNKLNKLTQGRILNINLTLKGNVCETQQNNYVFRFDASCLHVASLTLAAVDVSQMFTICKTFMMQILPTLAKNLSLLKSQPQRVLTRIVYAWRSIRACRNAHSVSHTSQLKRICSRELLYNMLC